MFLTLLANLAPPARHLRRQRVQHCATRPRRNGLVCFTSNSLATRDDRLVRPQRSCSHELCAPRTILVPRLKVRTCSGRGMKFKFQAQFHARRCTIKPDYTDHRTQIPAELIIMFAIYPPLSTRFHVRDQPAQPDFHRYRRPRILRRAFLQDSQTRKSARTVILSRRPRYSGHRQVPLLDAVADISLCQRGNVSATMASLKDVNGNLETQFFIVFNHNNDEAAHRCPEHLQAIFNMLRQVPYKPPATDGSRKIMSNELE